MAHARENDELRSEIRKDVAGTISLWPKVDGLNVAVSSSSYVVKDPSGTVIQSGTGTDTDVDGIDRIDCAVSPISTLDEDYTCHISWVYNGTTRLDVVQFDVVLWPFGGPEVSLNDMRELRADAEAILTRYGERLGQSSNKAEYAAGVCAYRARVALERFLRDRIDQDARTAASEHSTGLKNVKLWRPNAILNREVLKSAEAFLAVKHMYLVDMGAQDSGDESASHYEQWSELAAAEMRSIGPVKFDFNEDLRTDTIDETLGRSIRRRRV